MLRARVQQLILVLVAGVTVHTALPAVTDVIAVMRTAGAPALWLLALVTLGLGLTLFQVGRGLNRVASTPRWALALVGVWLMVGSLLLVLASVGGVLVGHELGGQLLGADSPWPTASTALALGVMLAVSTEAGLWLGRHPRLARAVLASGTAARDPVRRRRLAPECQRISAPVLVGWSDRGPPPRVSLPTI